MTEGENFQEQIKPDIEFEETSEGHRIIFNPDNKDYAPSALAIAAFSRAKVAKGGFLSGHADYKTEITPEIANELIQEAARDAEHSRNMGSPDDPASRTLFFMDYFKGKEVKLGAMRNEDGSITLIDREMKPISKEMAQQIAEDANFCLQDVIDAEMKE